MTLDLSVAAINVSVFLLMTQVGLAVSLLPKQIMDLSGSMAQVGFLAGAYAVGNILFQIPVGRLADRFGFKGFLVAGYLLCAVAGILFFISNTCFLVYLGRFVQGIGEAPIWALAPALLAMGHNSTKGWRMGVYNACLHAGLTAGGVLSMTLFATGSANRAFVLFVAASLAGALLNAVFVKNPKKENTPADRGHHLARPRILGRDRAVWMVLAGVLVYGAGYGCFITIIPGWLLSARGMDQAGIGLFFTMFYIALSLSLLTAGRFADKKGKKTVMLAGLAPACLGLAVFWRLSGAWTLGALFAAGAGLGIFCVSSMAFLNERVPESMKGTISGAFFFCWAAGYCLGPLALGQMGRVLGFAAAFLFLAAALGTVFSVLLFFLPAAGHVPASAGLAHSSERGEHG